MQKVPVPVGGRWKKEAEAGHGPNVRRPRAAATGRHGAGGKQFHGSGEEVELVEKICKTYTDLALMTTDPNGKPIRKNWFDQCLSQCKKSVVKKFKKGL